MRYHVFEKSAQSCIRMYPRSGWCVSFTRTEGENGKGRWGETHGSSQHLYGSSLPACDTSQVFHGSALLTYASPRLFYESTEPFNGLSELVYDLSAPASQSGEVAYRFSPHDNVIPVMIYGMFGHNDCIQMIANVICARFYGKAIPSSLSWRMACHTGGISYTIPTYWRSFPQELICRNPAVGPGCVLHVRGCVISASMRSPP